MIYNECKAFKFELVTVTLAVTLKYPFVAVEMSPLVRALIKHLSGLLSESSLNRPFYSCVLCDLAFAWK